jgi:hypothetical protein
MAAVLMSLFDNLGRRLVVLFLIAFGMELLGVSMVKLFGYVGYSVANNGFGFQEAAHGHPMDGLPGFGTGLLPPLVAAVLEFIPAVASVEVVDGRSPLQMRLWRSWALALAAYSKIWCFPLLLQWINGWRRRSGEEAMCS